MTDINNDYDEYINFLNILNNTEENEDTLFVVGSGSGDGSGDGCPCGDSNLVRVADLESTGGANYENNFYVSKVYTAADNYDSFEGPTVANATWRPFGGTVSNDINTIFTTGLNKLHPIQHAVLSLKASNTGAYDFYIHASGVGNTASDTSWHFVYASGTPSAEDVIEIDVTEIVKEALAHGGTVDLIFQRNTCDTLVDTTVDFYSDEVYLNIWYDDPIILTSGNSIEDPFADGSNTGNNWRRDDIETTNLYAGNLIHLDNSNLYSDNLKLRFTALSGVPDYMALIVKMPATYNEGKLFTIDAELRNLSNTLLAEIKDFPWIGDTSLIPLKIIDNSFDEEFELSLFIKYVPVLFCNDSAIPAVFTQTYNYQPEIEYIRLVHDAPALYDDNLDLWIGSSVSEDENITLHTWGFNTSANYEYFTSILGVNDASFANFVLGNNGDNSYQTKNTNLFIKGIDFGDANFYYEPVFPLIIVGNESYDEQLSLYIGEQPQGILGLYLQGVVPTEIDEELTLILLGTDASGENEKEQEFNLFILGASEDSKYTNINLFISGKNLSSEGYTDLIAFNDQEGTQASLDLIIKTPVTYEDGYYEDNSLNLFLRRAPAEKLDLFIQGPGDPSEQAMDLYTFSAQTLDESLNIEMPNVNDTLDNNVTLNIYGLT